MRQKPATPKTPEPDLSPPETTELAPPDVAVSEPTKPACGVCSGPLGRQWRAVTGLRIRVAQTELFAPLAAPVPLCASCAQAHIHALTELRQ